MAKAKKITVGFGGLYKKAFGKLTKKQLFVIAGACGVLALLIGATVLFARSTQQIAQQTTTAPAEQTQPQPQAATPVAEVKPSEEKPAEAPKPEQKSTAAPREAATPKLRAQPVQSPTNFQPVFVSPTMPVVQGCLNATERIASAHINKFSVGAKPGTVIQYRWELSGLTEGFKSALPAFGTTQTLTVGEQGAYIPGFAGNGVYGAFQVRVVVISPMETTSSWQQVNSSTVSCTF